MAWLDLAWGVINAYTRFTLQKNPRTPFFFFFFLDSGANLAGSIFTYSTISWQGSGSAAGSHCSGSRCVRMGAVLLKNCSRAISVMVSAETCPIVPVS